MKNPRIYKEMLDKEEKDWITKGNTFLKDLKYDQAIKAYDIVLIQNRSNKEV